MNHQKPWTNEEDLFLVNNYETMSNEELASELKRTAPAIDGRMNVLYLKRETLYILYDDGQAVFTGNKKECASFWELKISSIDYYASPSYKNRIKNRPNRRMAVRI